MSKPLSTKSIPEATQRLILNAAWELIAAQGRADVALTEIASRAGVTRQTVFYAFGNRAGLLTAMVRHKDTLSAHVGRIGAAVGVTDPDVDSVLVAVEAWLDYLPIIYPVGILLDAAALADDDAKRAWDDRMIAALRDGFRRLVQRVHVRTPLDGDPTKLADELWAQVHPSMWRRLVVECGWTPEAFRESRLRLLRALLSPRQPG